MSVLLIILAVIGAVSFIAMLFLIVSVVTMAVIEPPKGIDPGDYRV
jgi:hypothetical protein